MKISVRFFAFLIAVSVFQSCIKDPVDQPQDLVAPQIPAAAMYTMPTEAVETRGPDTIEAMNSGNTYNNWSHAVVNLAFWHTVVVINMAVPTAAFANAFNAQPEFIGNATFEWAYQYVAPPNLGGNTYNVVLTGQYIHNFEDVAWVMTVSQVGGFSNFVWYTGEVAVDGLSGQFTLNRFPYNPQEFVGITYTKDAITLDEETRFTNIIPNDASNGQYIEYQVAPTRYFNRGFNVQGPPNNFIEIQWNEPSNDGQVRHEMHFGDNEWHCWDVNGLDADCE